MELASSTPQRGISLSYLHLSNLIDDCCIGSLPLPAVAILRIILNRTLRINREWNSVTYEEIQHGVFVDGRRVQNGLGISSATIAKHIKGLVDAGILLVRSERSLRNGFFYSVYSIDQHAVRRVAMPSLPIPRKSREAYGAPSSAELQSFAKLKTPKTRARWAETINSGENSPTLEIEVTARSTRTTYGSKVQTKGILKYSGRSAHSPKVSVVRATAEETVQAVRETRAAAPAKPVQFFNEKGQLKQAALLSCWAKTVREHYPDAPLSNVTVKEFCMFRAVVSPLLETVSVPDIVSYLVSEWTTIVPALYISSPRWAASPVPDIPSVVRHWQTIRPMVIAYFAKSAVAHRHAAAAVVGRSIKEAEAIKKDNEELKKQLQRERNKVVELAEKHTELLTVAGRKGIDLLQEQDSLRRRRAKQQEQLAALPEADDLPEW